MTNATGLYNLVRTVGGSIGTSIFATMLARGQQASHAHLAEHTSPYSPGFNMAFQRLQGAFESRGLDPWSAHSAALASVEGLVSQQAAVLAFERTFGVAALLLILCVPLVGILRRPASMHKTAPVEVD